MCVFVRVSVCVYMSVYNYERKKARELKGDTYIYTDSNLNEGHCPISFSLDGVIDSIKDLPNNSAHGIDAVTPKILTECKAIAEPLPIFTIEKALETHWNYSNQLQRTSNCANS